MLKVGMFKILKNRKEEIQSIKCRIFFNNEAAIIFLKIG